MADLAAVFHWSPSTMNPMELDELMDWWNEARERATPEDKGD